MPKFALPAGVEIPEGLKSGDQFQTMATLVLGDSGKAMLIEIDGQPIAGYEKEGKKQKMKEAMKDYEEDKMEGGEEEGGMHGGNGGPRGFIAEVMSKRGMR